MHPTTAPAGRPASRQRRLPQACGALALLLALPAHAETQLDQVVVTAQKREESLQDVPISISAVAGERIAGAGIQRFGDLAAYVPNFSVTKLPIGDSNNIRGIQSGNQAGFEQSVATFVDGVYRGRGTQIRNAFVDVAMVEVLRGLRQSTLFGKNTTGGMVNVRTKRPVLGEWGLDFQQKIASYGRFEERFAANIPLGESLALRASGT